MPRPHIFRVGDKVRVVQPKFVARVGYPVCWVSLVPGFRQHPKMLEAMKILGMVGPDVRTVRGRAALAFAQGCAKAQNQLNGFGGNVRSIHYLDLGNDAEYYGSGVLEVRGKRTVRTGKYFPPSGGLHGDEYDFQNGGLEGAKMHILLRLNNGLEIEARNVSLVR